MTTDTLFLIVKQPYFDQEKSGEKPVEYRLYKNYWISRIIKNEKNLKRIEICNKRGTKKGDPNNLVFPWNGYTIETISHEVFGEPSEEVVVFAIPLVRS